MSPPTQRIHDDIILPFDVMNIKVILTQELHPTMLACIQVWLSKDILQAPMIAMQLKPMSQKKMPPMDKGMHYSREFQIMSGVVKLMVLDFSRTIGNYLTILHQHHTHTFQ